MSGNSVPLSRRLASISAFIAIITAGIAALAWRPAGKSYQEAPADADPLCSAASATLKPPR